MMVELSHTSVTHTAMFWVIKDVSLADEALNVNGAQLGGGADESGLPAL